MNSASTSPTQRTNVTDAADREAGVAKRGPRFPGIPVDDAPSPATETQPRPRYEAFGLVPVDESAPEVSAPTNAVIRDDWGGVIVQDADAQYRTGLRFLHGSGVQEDKTEAAKWYRKAAEQGHALAQFNLGVMYSTGEGVPEDDVEAVKWYRKAAEQGIPLAQLNLAGAYSEGVGVERDLGAAMKWTRKAADSGSYVAQYNMGAAYWSGDGVPRDGVQAVKWYRRAAEQNFYLAQFALGYMYSQGFGVLQDDVESLKWFLLASAGGHDDAVQQVKRLRGLLSTASYAEGQQRAKEWMARHVDMESDRGASESPPDDASQYPSTVSVSGSAFCIGADGFFLTCAHVVDGGISVSLVIGGHEYDAQVIKLDRVNDIAVLAVHGARFAPLPLRTDEPKLGDKVFTIGFPNPDIQGQAPKYTDGSISALSGLQDDPRAFQITVPVQSGNSGGPLVDEAGRCIGIVVSKLNAVTMLQYTGDMPQNVNFAIRAAYVWPLITTLPELARSLSAPTGQSPMGIADVERAVGLVRVRRPASAEPET